MATSARRSSDEPRPQAPEKDLYAEARRREIPGRSSMTKAELIEALR